MTNKAVARHLKLTADLVELTGGNPFRARAFASGARTVERLEEPVAELLAAGELVGVKGIGKGLAAEIGELLQTGTMGVTETLLQSLPPGIPEVLRVKGLGVKKVRALWTEAGVTSIEDLEAAAVSGRLEALDGFGAKTVQNILGAVEQLKAYRGKAHLRDAWAEAVAARDALRQAGHAADLAGAVRRQCNVVEGAALVTTAPPEAAAAALADWGAARPGGAEDGRVEGRLPLGLPLAAWSAPPAAYGSALFEHTGPDAHVAAVRERGGAGDHADEDDVYRAAGVEPIPAPLRDDPHWLDSGDRPALLTSADLRGTVHNHTTASDGSATLREMCDAARERGLGYFGVCDHSRSLQIAHGLSVDAVLGQVEEVARLNDDYAAEGVGFRVFSGSEVDILADGSMDFPDSVLAQLDVVVASVHQGFNMTEAEATARVVRAVSNPHVDVLGHPTGRLLLRREGYPLDHEAVLDACAEHGVAVELNANPWRLDVDWTFVRAARERGVLVSINPDAHSTDGLDDTRWGVASAQKGGLTAEGSLTSKTAGELAAWLGGAGR
ncbi:helix-hairpin-helix domain-containing protein [Rubrivirga litoralis]|uniref:Helix-hairpin-helix domain-containing protein n=1 Tax=Rubrivirga litoralis TaxID=3075598 RepID=A0ABU3BUC7_9BACT|nr:helix-hairpin-helix domain-containing protein [Rubrivirga sp. F394]MDT0632889.1 helix-hairpin-helix domain-containing protein [Rubrivirga sp. F394]